jgi:hypothetical protein
MMHVTVRSTRAADRPIDQVANLFRRGGHVHVFARDVLEQRHQIDFLLVVAAEHSARGLPDDRDDGLMVHACVVEAVQEMNGAGPRRRDAHPRR